MPWLQAISDPERLQRYIRDLIALTALPALWTKYGPQEIADSIAAALVSMLGADFVYVVLGRRQDTPEAEVIRTGPGATAISLSHIRASLHDACQRQSNDHVTASLNLSGGGRMQLAFAPIEFGSNAALMAGSIRHRFPAPEERLLLGIGSNVASIALQRWRSEADQRRFETLVEHSSDFIGVTTLEGHPQYINPAGLTFVGLSELEDISKLHIIDFFAPEYRVHARDQLWDIVMTEGRWRGELAFRQFRTGESLPVLIDWIRIDDPRSGEPMNLATVTRDLRLQEQAEDELRRANETLEQRIAARTFDLQATNSLLMKEIAQRELAVARQRELQLELFHAARLSAVGQMVAALAHELNQPLTAVTNTVNAARRCLAINGSGNFAAEDAMREVVEQTLRAGRIMRRMRDFVSHGDVEKCIVEVVGLIEDACALAMAGMGRLRVTPRLEFDPKAAQVLADRTQIQQVLVNLIRNAVEAMANSADRELVIRTSLLKGQTVEIAVADRGPGIAKDDLDHLFLPFHSTKRDGMGLGLSISRAIVEAHGGQIRCDDNPGGGTIFQFTLPTLPIDG